MSATPDGRRNWVAQILLSVSALAFCSVTGVGAWIFKQELDHLRGEVQATRQLLEGEVQATRQSFEKIAIESSSTKVTVQRLSADATKLQSALSSSRVAVSEVRQDQKAIKGEVKGLTGEVTKTVQTLRDHLKKLDSSVASHHAALTDLAKNDDSINRSVKRLSTAAENRIAKVEKKLAPLAGAVRKGKPGQEYVEFDPCPKEMPVNC